jgi:DNA-binding FrmR family transcriptional regulator
MLEGQEKSDVVKRLRRIEGQVRGLAEMIDSERYCIDVLTQIAATHEALRGVGRCVVENHLKTCVAGALANEDESVRDKILREFVDSMFKYAR